MVSIAPGHKVGDKDERVEIRYVVAPFPSLLALPKLMLIHREERQMILNMCIANLVRC